MNPDSSVQSSLVEVSVASFLARVANPDPAPGGGSAAALAGALGAALAGMVAGLALGKDGEGGASAIVAKAGDLRGRLAALIDEDAAAYTLVVMAYHLPRNTDEEKVARRAAVQEALKAAVATPMAAAEGCVAALHLSGSAAKVATRSAATDAGTAALLAHAGLAASLRNAEANLAGIRDAAFVAEARSRATALGVEGDAALRAAMAAVERGA